MLDEHSFLNQLFNCLLYTSNLITQLANGQVDGIPMVVAEWNDVSPTPFDADAMLEMTAYGSLQDWDGMCNFQYNGDADISGLKRKLLYFYFTMYNDPAKWGQIGISSYVFQKELIRKARNTIYMCYTADDLRANLNDSSMIPFATLPFISRVVTDVYKRQALSYRLQYSYVNNRNKTDRCRLSG